MVIGSQPDDRMIVFIFVNGFDANFMPIEVQRLLMESCTIVLFRLEGVSTNFPVAEIIRYLIRLV